MKFYSSVLLVLTASKSSFGFITSENNVLQRELQNATVSECAIDGEKSLDCGSKEGKQSCCEGLVCHDVQYWRCVTEDKNICAGPGTLAKKCGSDWIDAATECCDGLECDGKFCIDPTIKEDEAELECAADGEKSRGCGSNKGKQSCCEGLVCHEVQKWRCVKEENKFCSGEGTLSKQCGSNWRGAAKSCCPGLECDGKFCRLPEDEGDPVCAVDGEKSLDCGSKEGKQSCCEGLVCHESQYWRCVKEEKKTCSGPNTLSKKCGSGWKDAEDECCEGLICSGNYCVDVEQDSGPIEDPIIIVTKAPTDTPTEPPTDIPTKAPTEAPTVIPTTAATAQRIACPRGYTGLIPSKNCKGFYHCVNGRFWHNRPQSCGPGTLFNPKHKVCDWPRNVRCPV